MPRSGKGEFIERNKWNGEKLKETCWCKLKKSMEENSHQGGRGSTNHFIKKLHLKKESSFKKNSKFAKYPKRGAFCR